MGIEVLLHDLSNPTRSIAGIEGGEVTGRTLEMGTTTLLIDLKRRRAQNQDKLNYELNIGSRRFKCTTIPIIRKDYGVVGAVCINIDINYIRDDVLSSMERVQEFLRHYCRTDMQLEENILSRDEYQKALQGKKHFRDSTRWRALITPPDRRLDAYWSLRGLASAARSAFIWRTSIGRISLIGQ